MALTQAASPVRGILCMIVGTLVLTTHDAISKALLEVMHTGEIIAWRGVLSLPIVLLLLRLEGDSWGSLRSRAPVKTALRGFLALLTSALVILSFKVMPLADALAIIFASPLIVTALSATLLKEPVGWRRWTATCTGFAGAVIIVGPGFEAVGLWALAPVWAAVLGYLIWDDMPGLQTIIGAVIIMGAGLYTLRRESRLAKQSG